MLQYAHTILKYVPSLCQGKKLFWLFSAICCDFVKHPSYSFKKYYEKLITIGMSVSYETMLLLFHSTTAYKSSLYPSASLRGANPGATAHLLIPLYCLIRAVLRVWPPQDTDSHWDRCGRNQPPLHCCFSLTCLIQSKTVSESDRTVKGKIFFYIDHFLHSDASKMNAPCFLFFFVFFFCTTVMSSGTQTNIRTSMSALGRYILHCQPRI